MSYNNWRYTQDFRELFQLHECDAYLQYEHV